MTALMPVQIGEDPGIQHVGMVKKWIIRLILFQHAHITDFAVTWW